MRYFVTGGAGFIGSHLVDRLIEQGNVVTVYDNLSSGKKQFIEHHLNQNDFHFVQADLRDARRIETEVKDHDGVFHIAANPDVRLGAQKPEVAQHDIQGTYNLLDAMRKNDIKKMVFSSSSTVYGETPGFPLPEDYGPLLPISMYGAAKLAAEGLISSFCHTFDLQCWMYRFANVVGQRGTHGVIVDFIHKLKRDPKKLEILGDGRQQKPYLYVSDCVDGMMFGFHHGHDQINLFNLGCSTNTTVTRIAELVVDEMGLNDVEFHYSGGKRGWKGDIPRFRLDIRKMKNLGWEARFMSDEAVKKAVRDLLANL